MKIKKSHKIGAWLCLTEVVFIIMLGTAVLFISEAGKKPAWVEIYTNAMCGVMGGGGDDTYQICSVEGCHIGDGNEISAGWHYNLFSMERDIYITAALSFFAGAMFLSLLTAAFDYGKAVQREEKVR